MTTKVNVFLLFGNNNQQKNNKISQSPTDLCICRSKGYFNEMQHYKYASPKKSGVRDFSLGKAVISRSNGLNENNINNKLIGRIFNSIDELIIYINMRQNRPQAV